MIVSLSDIKICDVVLSFYANPMKRKTLQACFLKHRIKKGIFSVLGKLDLFKSGRGSPLLPPLHLTMRLLNWLSFLKTCLLIFIRPCKHSDEKADQEKDALILLVVMAQFCKWLTLFCKFLFRNLHGHYFSVPCFMSVQFDSTSIVISVGFIFMQWMYGLGSRLDCLIDS